MGSILVKEGDSFNRMTKKFVADTVEDATLADAVFGDECYVIQEQKMYIMDSSGTWVEK